jgi:glycine/D-amino acid oxidase-like deaminating enzyme
VWQNGGHCQPGVWDSPPEVARFELETFDQLQELIRKHDIPCDWRVVGGIHGVYSPDVLDAVKDQIERLQQYPDLRDKAVLIQDKEELATRRIPEALAAVYQPMAAQLWPYKLVAWLLERLLDEHDVTTFNLQTNTPVTRIEPREEGGSSSWLVYTDRGHVRTRDVLLATNAYTSHLVPSMAGLITPVRAQVCALEPPPGAKQLPHSYVWIKGADHQYLIQRGLEDAQVNDGEHEGAVKLQLEDRSIVFGGERPAAEGRDEGIACDDEVDPAVSRALQRGIHDALDLCPDKSNVNNKSDKPPEPLRAAYEWTGIMGYSSDGDPWVGHVPESLLNGEGTAAPPDATGKVAHDGLWISAGYTGHGMPVAARCGVAVAQMMSGRQDGVQVPKQWMATDSRVRAARSAVLPRTLDELLQHLPAK